MPQDFTKRITQLSTDLEAQGRRVQALLELALDAFFTRDGVKAAKVNSDDDAIDASDVAIEKACVALLNDATNEGASLGESDLRRVLTIVKVNNELERVADVAVDLSDLVKPMANSASATRAFPATFRMMANSVIGILRDTTTAFARMDAPLAKVVLQSQHCVTAFKDAIIRDGEQQIAKGQMTIEFAFLLLEVASQCELVADHCTNVAEQIIYSSTGAIVRHTPTQWIEIPRQG
ncbi:MAG: phosphate signaling complex PhoU family protein [Phycisphaerales bacterium]